MLSRRRLLANLAAGTAGSLLPTVSWAEAGDPALLAAAREADGSFALFGLSDTGERLFRIPLPDRGHAAAAHPARAEAVAFARRPGTFALVLDCASGTVRHRLDAPEGRHFYGHGAYLEDGAVLVTSENDIATGQGVLGLWDATAGYVRRGEVPSGGIGPHEILRLPGTDTLAVANGGIRTHPDRGREKLNLDTMRPNLSYIREGAVIDRVELDPALRQASIRHLAARADGTVAFAMQWQGPESETVPLLGLHRSGTAPRLLSADDPAQARLQGYAGSVAFSGDGRTVAITGPRGGVAHLYDAGAGGAPELLHRPDICGTATTRAGLAFTDGFGGVIVDGAAARHPVAWDNHLVSLARPTR